MIPLESPSASGSHRCASRRCSTGWLRSAGSSWLGRVSSVRLPFAVEEAAACSHFCLAMCSLPRGCSTVWLGWRKADLSQICIIFQQSFVNLLVSVFCLRKVLSENAKESQEERSCSAVAHESCLNLSCSSQSKINKCMLLFRDVCKPDASWHMKNLVTPELLIFLPTCTYLLSCVSVWRRMLWSLGTHPFLNTMSFCHFPSLLWYCVP